MKTSVLGCSLSSMTELLPFWEEWAGDSISWLEGLKLCNCDKMLNYSRDKNMFVNCCTLTKMPYFTKGFFMPKIHFIDAELLLKIHLYVQSFAL